MTWLSPWSAVDATPPLHVGAQIVPAGAPVEPITLDQAKKFLRVTVPDDDDDISGFITAARLFCERRVGYAIAEQACDVYYDAVDPYASIVVPVAPVLEVTSITTTDTANVATIMDPALYLVDLASRPARIGLPSGGRWPSSLRSFQGFAIRLVVGYAETPEDLLQAIRLMLGHYYENRTAVESGHIMTTLPLGVDELLAPYELITVI